MLGVPYNKKFLKICLILFLVIGRLPLVGFGVYLARRRRLQSSASSAFRSFVSQ
jgi:hypothetical protein